VGAFQLLKLSRS